MEEHGYTVELRHVVIDAPHFVIQPMYSGGTFDPRQSGRVPGRRDDVRRCLGTARKTDSWSRYHRIECTVPKCLRAPDAGANGHWSISGPLRPYTWALGTSQTNKAPQKPPIQSRPNQTSTVSPLEQDDACRRLRFRLARPLTRQSFSVSKRA